MSQAVRRLATPVAASLAIAVLLAGCASSAPGQEGSDAPTRTVTSEIGAAEVPLDPKMIVALDEPSALNLISIGITPDVVFDSWRTTVPKAILAEEGVKVVSTASFYPELEEVAALEPDLIVGTAAEGFAQGAPDYTSVAPTVAGLYTAPGQQIIEAYGEYFDRQDEAAKVVAALDALTAENQAAQGEQPASLSVLMSWAQDNMPLYMDAANSLHQGIEDSGFTRPQLQTEVPKEGSAFGGWTPFSAEQLPEHDADVLAVAVAAQYNLEGITGLPLYSSLDAVKSGHSVVVDGDLWSGGAAFYTYWALSDLSSLASGAFAPGTEADAGERWSSYVAAIRN